MRRLGQAAIGRTEPEPQPRTLFEAHDEVERVLGGRELEGARCASMKPRPNRTNAREFRLAPRGEENGNKQQHAPSAIT